jgi:hypothetical protein
MDRCGALSGVGIHGFAVRQMDNTARAEFRVESEHRREQKSKWCWRRKIQSHTSVTGRGVKDARIHLKVDKHTGEPKPPQPRLIYRKGLS